ncbi:unnamed protein product [Symbiodinium necroappetens]|uniref:Uncharacterized protein n=1 Tax=Symbiodinium necroappetens TaxID=1628268 RepID=A0A812PX85_9DINO|nr:unnamed protein product [Symbiodinium necroappetens]
MVSEPACKEYQAQVAAMEVSTEAAYQELARRREEVIASLGSWCQALKAIRAPQTAPLEADGDPKETSQLQSHLRDALFVEICNALAFPGAAALAKPATPTKVVSQRQVSTSAAVVSVRTPRTPQKPSPRGSRESLSSRATSLTPRPSPLSALGRKDARPVQPLVPRQRCPPTNNVPEKRPTGRIERTSERPVVTRSQQFQMPAFAGVRRSSSPRNSSQPLSARSSSLRYCDMAFEGTMVQNLRSSSISVLEETAWVITGGGGGVTAEMLPHGAQKELTWDMCRAIPIHFARCAACRSTNGQDDAYGFMDPHAFWGVFAVRQRLLASGHLGTPGVARALSSEVKSPLELGPATSGHLPREDRDHRHLPRRSRAKQDRWSFSSLFSCHGSKSYLRDTM